jgi:hypothetical protein
MNRNSGIPDVLHSNAGGLVLVSKKPSVTFVAGGFLALVISEQFPVISKGGPRQNWKRACFYIWLYALE